MHQCMSDDPALVGQRMAVIDTTPGDHETVYADEIQEMSGLAKNQTLALDEDVSIPVLAFTAHVLDTARANKHKKIPAKTILDLYDAYTK